MTKFEGVIFSVLLSGSSVLCIFMFKENRELKRDIGLSEARLQREMDATEEYRHKFKYAVQKQNECAEMYNSLVRWLKSPSNKDEAI